MFEESSIHLRMFNQIVKQYEDQITFLKEKIETQKEEIESLLDLVEVMNKQLSGKVYDI